MRSLLNPHDVVSRPTGLRPPLDLINASLRILDGGSNQQIRPIGLPSWQDVVEFHHHDAEGLGVVGYRVVEPFECCCHTVLTSAVPGSVPGLYPAFLRPDGP